MSYKNYGEYPTEIPVTPIENVHPSHSPRRVAVESYSYAPQPLPAPYQRAISAAADVVSPYLQELKQIKYILIGVGILLFLLLILRK